MSETSRYGRTVYIGLRRIDRLKGKAVYCGSIRAIDFAPEEVKALILRALKNAARLHQRKTRT